MAPIRGTLKQHRCCGFINTHPIPRLLLANASSRHKQVLCRPCPCHGVAPSAPRGGFGELPGKGWHQTKGYQGQQRLNPSLVVAASWVSCFGGMSPAGRMLRQSRERSLHVPALLLISRTRCAARAGRRAAAFTCSLELFKKPVCSRRFIGRLCPIK